MEDLIGLIAVISIFVILPWMILHYRSKHRAEDKATAEQHTIASTDLARLAERLEQRLDAIETILDAEAPNWRAAADRETR